MATQHYVHLFTGPDNLSHFKDVEVELSDRGAASFLSDTMPATGLSSVLTITAPTDAAYCAAHKTPAICLPAAKK